MANIEKYLEIVKERNPGEQQFFEGVEEVLRSIEPVLDAHPEYEEAGLVERLIEPERVVSFRVPWVDDNGKVQVNRGFRIQFNSALGPYKGGTRFAPHLDPSTLKYLAFEQIFKNSLSTLPIGGGKGGADFDPNGKSDAEVMRFCQSYITELFRYLGPDTDVPAGDLGVGGREIGYMMGQQKRLTNTYDGTWTGKGTKNGGLAGRTEATGFGIVFFLREMLKHLGQDFAGKTAVVSGFGNVAWGTVKKLDELGAKVVTISGPDGYIYDEDGISGDEKINFMLELRNSGKNICKPYADKFGAKFVAGRRPWEVKADLYLPCAMQNDITLEYAKLMVENDCKILCEGANGPTTPDAIEYLKEHDVIIGPCKAANAGGVACSCLEMSQNAQHIFFTEEDVYNQLEGIMVSIHKQAEAACAKYDLGYDLMAGANIAGFERLANAMMMQGIV